jgi:hypothetical protein
MVKNPFLFFALIPFENKGDSSSSLMDRSKTMTPEKFLKHGFSFFCHFETFFIEVRLIFIFQVLDLANSTPGQEQLF